MKRGRHLSTGLLFAFAMGACAPRLRENANDVDPNLESKVVTERDAETGLLSTRVAAVDSEAWIYFSFETADQAYVIDSAHDRGWDLRMSRFNIRVNGGVSGPGHVEVAPLSRVRLDDILIAPSTGYFTDEDDQDGDGREELVFRRKNEASENGWFEYDDRFHTVKPAEISYVVHAMNETYYKLAFRGFYDENGEGGFVRFSWAAIASP